MASAVAGLGVGTVFAALPALIVAAVPPEEMGSAMGLNQVMRYIGFAIGSAASATVLEAATAPGADSPGTGGYQAIGLIGVGACIALTLLTVSLRTRTASPR